VMACGCLLYREALSQLGAGMAPRLAATVAAGALIYAVALWLFAPDIWRRALLLARGALGKLPGPGRRRVTAV